MAPGDQPAAAVVTQPARTTVHDGIRWLPVAAGGRTRR